MKSITLSKPVAGARGPVAALRFREPTFDDWMALGDPETPLWTGSGEHRSVVIQQHPQIVGAYAERLLVDEDVNLLRMASLRDTLAIREVIMGFFREAERPDTSGGSQTNLSST